MSDVVIAPKKDIAARQKLSYFLAAITIIIAALAGRQFEASQQEVETARIAREEAEVKRDEALKKAALIIESSPWAIIVCNEHGTITNTNSAAEKMLGWSHEEMVGKNSDFLLVPVEFRAAHEKGIVEAAKKLQAYNGDWLLTSSRRPVKVLVKSGETIDAVSTVRAIKYGHDIDFILSLSSSKPPAPGPFKLQAPEKISDVVQGIADRNPAFSAVLNKQADTQEKTGD